MHQHEEDALRGVAATARSSIRSLFKLRGTPRGSRAPIGRAKESFELSLPDEWEVNPTLLHVLRRDFAVDISAGELLDLLDEGGAGAPDTSRLFERLAKAAWSVPGLAVSPRVGLGNFSYAKWDMVQDIEGGLDALVASDLLCAIASYAPAGQAIRDRQMSAEISEPDRVAPAREFPVPDAKALTDAASIGVADVAGVPRTLVRRPDLRASLWRAGLAPLSGCCPGG